MYNEAIVTSPVALFVGAGASKPLGKMLMSEFISFLEGKSDYGSSPLFRAIVSKQRDLEFLFEELEDWVKKNYLGEKLVMPRLTMPGSSRPLEYVDRVIDAAEHLLADLRKDVFEQYRGIRNVAAVNSLFNPVFDSIFERIGLGKNCLPVFTTNYDPAIEVFGARNSEQYLLDDGFSAMANNPNHSWSKRHFESLRVDQEKRHLVLFKLHGSTNWFKDRTTDPPRILKSDVVVHLPEDPNYENLLIYPAERKLLLDDPYFTAYDYFHRTLEHCKLCIVIGYSFRDNDALSRLRSAASLNEHLKILIVDPCAEVLSIMLEKYGVHADHAVSYFGDVGKKTLPSSPKLGDDYMAKIKTALANLDSSDSTDSAGDLDSLDEPDPFDSSLP